MTTEPPAKRLPILYFLGPEGTYTQQAGRDLFGKNVHYEAIGTIRGLFDALSNCSIASDALAIAPIENSYHGPVVDTLDALRLPLVGKAIFIRGEFEFPIHHSLVAREESRSEDIEAIASHEQALGQCRNYLEVNFPNAAMIETPSTAAATELVIKDKSTAAICSKLCAELNPGLVTIAQNIQDSLSNSTRFVVLSTSLRRPIPFVTSPNAMQRCSTFRFTGPALKSLKYILPHAELIRVDRRPGLPNESNSPFRDVHFVTLKSDYPRDPVSDDTWCQQIEELSRICNTCDPGHDDVTLLGVW